MSIETKRAELNRATLILQLAVSLNESPDLNDEDASLLAELTQHSVIQTALGRKLKTTQPNAKLRLHNSTVE